MLFSPGIKKKKNSLEGDPLKHGNWRKRDYFVSPVSCYVICNFDALATKKMGSRGNICQFKSLLNFHSEKAASKMTAKSFV